MFFSRPWKNKMFEASRVELSSEDDDAHWATARDLIQDRKPFAIFNFLNRDRYNEFLKDLEQVKDYSFFRQTLHTSEDEVLEKTQVPSVFIFPKEDADSVKFFTIIRDSLKHYNLESVILGFENGEKITAEYKDGNKITVGNEIVSGLSPDEMEGDDFFQTGSNYYKFISI